MDNPQVTQQNHDSLISPDDNRRMFDSLARHYDLMNRVLSMGLDHRWRRKAVEALAPRAGGRYLDIGCGTGDVGIEIIRQCQNAKVVGIDPAENMLDVAAAKNAKVVGIDPAEKMLEVAAAKIAKADLADSISFQAGDAAELSFDDGSFAGVITAFCFRNMSDRARALGEMRRVLAIGGRVVILELTTPTQPVVRIGHRLYNRWLVPTVGGLIARSKAAYSYLVQSVEAFPQVEEVVEMLNAAGFVNARAASVSGGIVTIFSGEVE